jgi:streptomycin 3"-adenylyltransferase
MEAAPATIEPAAARQVQAAAGLVRDVLGDDAVAAYLYGSAVSGGLRPDSDLDVFVVSRRPTTLVQRRALVDRLLSISGRRAAAGPARSLELTIVVEAELRPWRYPPTMDFLYGDWLREAFERGDLPEPRPNPDLAVLITTLLGAARPLFGPPAAMVLDPVPRTDLERALVEVIPGLLADLRDDTRNVLLTLARIRVTLETGRIQPKDVAADRLIPRVPAELRPVLARARDGYLGLAADPWDDRSGIVARLAEHLVAEIRLAASQDGDA